MARQKREWYEGAKYHVMGRGNRRTAIFRAEEDYQYFLMTLRKVQKKFPFDLYAFCLMTNHFHLEVGTLTDPIWKIMQPLMSQYARTFNQKYQFEGHLFDSRYTSCLISNETYFLEVSRYIHLNPVKAAMVQEPLSYPYSSYKYYVSHDKHPKEIKLDTSSILACFGHDSYEQYRMFVESRMPHTEQEALIQKDIKEDDNWLPW